MCSSDLDADAIYQASAAETGGTLGIRYVHTSSCVIGVGSVVLSPTGDDTFDNTISELQGLGYSSTDRKYMLFVDANVYCGIGGIYGDERPGQENWNNQGPSYGRTDAGCWGGHTAAHELMHNLGGIQLGAPNTSGGWHCVDEYDVMCYSDSPNFPTMRIDCADTGHEYRLDCNHDDYFSTSPPAGSYLALNWNAANSRFLTTSVTPPPCLDSATEPDDSAAQARTVAVPSTSSRAFCLAGDGDWVKFSAGAGRTYRLDTLNLAGGTDTVIELYATDGATLLASDDDGGGFPNSLITWTAPTSGTYYLKARQYNGAGSVAQTYDLRVTELDSTAPTVTARSPAANARSVSQSANITATFSEAVQGVASSTFTLRDPGGASVAAVVSRNGTTNQWILNPNATLLANTRYTVRLTGGTTAIRDLAGNRLTTTSWTYTTGS